MEIENGMEKEKFWIGVKKNRTPTDYTFCFQLFCFFSVFSCRLSSCCSTLGLKLNAFFFNWDASRNDCSNENGENLPNCHICPADFAFTNLNITKLHNQADFALKNLTKICQNHQIHEHSFGLTKCCQICHFHYCMHF